MRTARTWSFFFLRMHSTLSSSVIVVVVVVVPEEPASIGLQWAVPDWGKNPCFFWSFQSGQRVRVRRQR